MYAHSFGKGVFGDLSLLGNLPIYEYLGLAYRMAWEYMVYILRTIGIKYLLSNSSMFLLVPIWVVRAWHLYLDIIDGTPSVCLVHDLIIMFIRVSRLHIIITMLTDHEFYQFRCNLKGFGSGDSNMFSGLLKLRY